MDKITISGHEQELKFTFNSFKYMQEFNPDEFDEIESHPFKLIPLVTMLLMGATNGSPKIKYTEDDICDFLDVYVETESLSDLMQSLMGKLQESSFFKSLQKTAE